MSNNEMFDGVLMNMVQKAEGIEGFYDAIFGFMRRKTDFFSSADKGKKVVLEHFDRHEQLFREDTERKELIRKKQEERKRKEEEEARAKAQPKPATEETDSKVEEITDEEAERIMKQQDNETNQDSQPANSEEAKEKGEGEDSEDDGVAPLLGNGLRTDKYFFSQTLGDITINVMIPPTIKAKDLNVVYGSQKLKVQIKGQEPIIDGELPYKVLAEETLWTVETVDGERVCSITLDKADKMKWWECAIVGDTKINTKKIEPENSKLSDLDGETRQTVEKMMFDQQQKQKGLPTSDEMEKKAKLKAFMDAHPEMDFSKAKFS